MPEMNEFELCASFKLPVIKIRINLSINVDEYTIMIFEL